MIFRRSTGKAVRSTIDVRDGRGDERGSILSYAGKCVKY